MSYVVTKSSLKGTVKVPSSKSHTMRALLFAALAQGKSRLEGILPSPDTDAMIDACRKLGAKFEIGDYIDVEGISGDVSHAEDVIHANNSGIILRFLTAVGALGNHPFVITGDHSIKYQRPIKPLLEGLEQLGVETHSMRGDHFAPVIVKGPIRKNRAVISGEDSQTVSALLIAASLHDEPIEIEVNNPGEIPWVKMTLDWFDKLGIKYENDRFCRYKVYRHQFEGFSYRVPGDFSSAAFPIAAALVTGSELIVENLDFEDIQGDKKLIEILQSMGADICFDTYLHVRKSALKGIKVDINECIDALPILAVVACYAEGVTEIHNAKIARKKECDRIHAIANELKKMGAYIEEKEDGLIIEGTPLHGATVDSHHDHRMAMALTVAGMGATSDTHVKNTACVNKTYPHFLKDFTALGANIHGQ